MPTYGIPAAVAVLVVLFFIYRILASASAKKAERDKSEQAQILRLFVAGEKLNGAQITVRLEERTGARRAFFVYNHLDVLVAEGKLMVKVAPYQLKAEEGSSKEYFLPK